jgi:hypothetical protein
VIISLDSTFITINLAIGFQPAGRGLPLLTLILLGASLCLLPQGPVTWCPPNNAGALLWNNQAKRKSFIKRAFVLATVDKAFIQHGPIQ